ncbi:alpha/beta hydrolase [Clostridium butyricum]|uniref:alpha/beta hydrolase n=2 Tax=Clostridium TaxID=1485 RepID=UPI002013626E|nr:alpha/beta hydrolase [Clostridium butyricum]MDB2159283.1 alpha/beta hydrolase [Clostridium butyricum]
MVKLLISIYCFVVLIIMSIIVTLCIIEKKKKLYNSHKIINKEGIDEEVILEIGGIKQYLYIRGENLNKPVILFLHGGPGTSMIPELHTYQYLWEKDYVFVNYDQRSANMSYYLNKKNWNEVSKTIECNIFIKDAKEVVDYLLKRFNKNKIIIMGHSWGSFVGIKFAQMYPEITYAYIGIGQVMNYKKSMIQLAHEVKSKINSNDKNKSVIDSIIDELHADKRLGLKLVSKLVTLSQKYLRQTKHNETLMMFCQSLISPHMPLKYIPYYAKSNKYNNVLYDTVFNWNIYEYKKSYKCPIILVSGELDYACIFDTGNFIEYINAPYKCNIVIKDSGHICMMENPGEFFNKINTRLKEISVLKNS